MEVFGAFFFGYDKIVHSLLGRNWLLKDDGSLPLLQSGAFFSKHDHHGPRVAFCFIEYFFEVFFDEIVKILFLFYFCVELLPEL